MHYFELIIFIYVLFCTIFFFFKQKTAYEMRISDWSSDVCSSDLDHAPARIVVRALVRFGCLAAGLAHAALLATFESQEHMHLVATTRSSNAYRRNGSGNRHQGGNHPLLRARGHPSSCRQNRSQLPRTIGRASAKERVGQQG